MSSKSIIISHRKDADGISSAALIRNFTDGEIFLVDYGEMVETLSRIGGSSDYYICDLGSNQKTFEGFLEQVTRFAKSGSVYYIDHHQISKESIERLVAADVQVTHSVEECASVLVYKTFEKKFHSPEKMKILASCGAITDYMDNKPVAKKIIASFDRQFLLYEATVLSFAIAVIGRDRVTGNSRLARLAEQLAEGLLPHEIEGSSELAQEYARSSAELLQMVKQKGKKLKNFAYFITTESATGNVANFLIGAFDTPVGVALREEDPGYYEVSLRSVDESPHDLGKIIRRVSANLNASGGGHHHASGARILRTQLDEFLSTLDQELSQAI